MIVISLVAIIYFSETIKVSNRKGVELTDLVQIQVNKENDSRKFSSVFIFK